MRCLVAAGFFFFEQQLHPAVAPPFLEAFASSAQRQVGEQHITTLSVRARTVLHTYMLECWYLRLCCMRFDREKTELNNAWGIEGLRTLFEQSH